MTSFSRRGGQKVFTLSLSKLHIQMFPEITHAWIRMGTYLNITNYEIITSNDLYLCIPVAVFHCRTNCL